MPGPPRITIAPPRTSMASIRSSRTLTACSRPYKNTVATAKMIASARAVGNHASDRYPTRLAARRPRRHALRGPSAEWS